jgi:ribosome biogenesis GTPase A
MTPQETRQALKSRTKDLLVSKLKVVDLVFEVLDARAPLSTSSIVVQQITGHKERLLVLNKTDLADPLVTSQWLNYFRQEGRRALAVNAHSGSGLQEVRGLMQQMAAELNSKLAVKGRSPRELRTAVFGIPNTGKSTFLNKLIGRHVAATGDRPGITRGPQWVHLVGKISVLDTPGVFPPYLRGAERIFKLAVIGALEEGIYDLQNVSARLLDLLNNEHPEQLVVLSSDLQEQPVTFESMALHKGFLLQDGVPDTQRAAVFFLNQLRAGKFGGITLELPPR